MTRVHGGSGDDSDADAAGLGGHPGWRLESASGDVEHFDAVILATDSASHLATGCVRSLAETEECEAMGPEARQRITDLADELSKLREVSLSLS